MHPTHQPAVPDTDSPATVLRAAALYLERHGWHRGAIFAHKQEPFPAACALGAITVAVLGTPDWDVLFDKYPECQAAIEVLALHLAADIPYDLVDLDLIDLIEWVSGWNDAEGRTQQEVQKALHTAADEWETDHPGGAA